MPRTRPGLTRVTIVLSGVLILAVVGPPAGGAEAQSTPAAHTVRLANGAPPAPARIPDAAWLTGRWKGEGLGAVAEELWLPPAGAAMSGVFRLVRGDSVQFYELAALVEERGSLTLLIKHFGPSLQGWEEKDEVQRFPLVRKESDALWFDGLTIRQVGDDALRIWVLLEHREGGSREALFEYRRQDTRGAGP